ERHLGRADRRRAGRGPAAVSFAGGADAGPVNPAGAGPPQLSAVLRGPSALARRHLDAIDGHAVVGGPAHGIAVADRASRLFFATAVLHSFANRRCRYRAG